MLIKIVRAPTRISFRFDPEKLANVLAFLAERVKDLDKLKAAKLLYFADKYHLVRYGRPIIGDRYHSLDYGPVPSKALDIMNQAMHDDPPVVAKQPLRRLLERYIEVDKGYRHPRFRAKRHPDQDVFSESEIEALEHTLANYGGKSGAELINISHKEAAWKDVKGYGEIDYRLFLKDASPASGNIVRLLEVDQETRDLVDLINEL
jgi:uncharacterized phage-associated protein